MLSDYDLLQLWTFGFRSSTCIYSSRHFNVALTATWRHGIWTKLNRHQVSETTALQRHVIRLRCLMSVKALSKAVKLGLRACNEKLVEQMVWTFTQLNGKVCIYDDIKLYFKATKKFMIRETIYVSINYGLRKRNSCSLIKNQNLDEQTLPKYIRQVFEKLGVSGEWLPDNVFMYGLFSMAITNRLKAGLDLESVSMQTVHRHRQYLKSYQFMSGLFVHRLKRSWIPGIHSSEDKCGCLHSWIILGHL